VDARNGFSVGEAAEKVGLSAHTLRWYERIGLIDAVARDGGGRRRYTATDLDRLVFLTKLRATGMPVADMSRYVDLIRQGPDTAPDRLALLERHRARVLARIGDLKTDLDIIERKITHYRAAKTPAPAP